MSLFNPALETHLGAKILWDNKTKRDYLWVTGDVYNAGYGVAYNAGLQVKLYSSNSSIPEVLTFPLGDLDIHNKFRIFHAFFSEGSIVRYQLFAYCNQSK